MTAADTPSMTSAWDDPATQAFLRPKRIASHVLAAVVGVFVVIAIALGTIQSGKANRLSRDGVHTKGVILWVHDRGCDDPRGPVVIKAAVRFDVDRTSQTQIFNTSCGRGLFKGAVVPVAYDPNNPAEFAVAGFASDNPAFAVVDVFGGAIAFTSAILALGFIVERHNRKRLLRQTPWIPTSLLFVRGQPVGRGAPSFATVLTTPIGQKVFRGSDPNHRVIADQPLQILEVAGNNNDRRAVRRPGERRIIFLSTRMSNKVAQKAWNDWHRSQQG